MPDLKNMVILGKDFLDFFKCVNDCSNNVLQIADKRIAFVLPNRASNKTPVDANETDLFPSEPTDENLPEITIHVVETSVIHPYTECVIPATTKAGHYPEICGSIEPRASL